jgi:WS/DGAT/MGAT family acyltransferase
MAAGDAAWLHMDRRTNRMIVNSVMWFDEPLDWVAVRALLQARLIDRFPRFSQRVVDSAGGVWWEDDEPCDLERHLRYARLPEPGGQAELERYVSDRAGEPLARDLPLWEIHLIDGYRGNGSAVLSRIHHCVADGVALAQVMLSLTDDPQESASVAVAAPHEAAGTRVVDGLEHLAGGMIDQLRHPTRLPGHVRDVVAITREVGRLVMMPPDTRSCLRGELGERKSVVWSEPYALRDISAAAHAGEATVNDLLLTAVSGALRTHLARHDGQAPDVRAVIPINLRPLDEPLPVELGNDFGLLFLQLPVSVDGSLARLAEMHKRTEQLKTSTEPVVSFAILDITGHTPYQAQQVFVELFAAKASAVMTNVPGPQRPVFLAGRRVRGTMGWPPESGRIGLGVSIISYDGEVRLGLMTDDRLVRDPRRLLADATAELDRLLTGLRAVASAGASAG